MEENKLMDNYKQLLEGMSKEELISEIGKLLVDKGLLLNSRDGYINELKEDNGRLNKLLADGTEVMDYWQDKYLEEKTRNDELQKQVDELKGYIDFKTENVMCEKCKEQAVKDTAKEIFTKLYRELAQMKSCLDPDYEPYYEALKKLEVLKLVRKTAKERYGVEVE